MALGNEDQVKPDPSVQTNQKRHQYASLPRHQANNVEILRLKRMCLMIRDAYLQVVGLLLASPSKPLCKTICEGSYSKSHQPRVVEVEAARGAASANLPGQLLGTRAKDVVRGGTQTRPVSLHPPTSSAEACRCRKKESFSLQKRSVCVCVCALPSGCLCNSFFFGGVLEAALFIVKMIVLPTGGGVSKQH